MKLPIEAIQAATADSELSEVTAAVDMNSPLPGFEQYSYIEYLKDDQKAKSRFIKYLESQARSSFELRGYLQLIRENVELTKCKILSGVSSEDARIELHHFPFSMYDIARIILDDALDSQADISSFGLVSKIVAEHYEGNIGLVPLSVTIHELVHDGKVSLSLRSVTGNWQAFAKKFSHVLTEQDISNLKFLVRSSATPEMDLHNIRKLKVLKRNIIPKSIDEEKYTETRENLPLCREET